MPDYDAIKLRTDAACPTCRPALPEPIASFQLEPGKYMGGRLRCLRASGKISPESIEEAKARRHR